MGGNKNKPKGKKRYYLLLPAIAILLALGIVADILYPSYSQVVNNALGASATASGDYVTLALENSKDVNIRLEEEGAVLLKNEGVMPFQTSTTFSFFGHSSVSNIGSGNLKGSFESEGFGVNEGLWNFYESGKGSEGYGLGAG